MSWLQVKTLGNEDHFHINTNQFGAIPLLRSLTAFFESSRGRLNENIKN